MTLPIAIYTTGRPVPSAERRRGSFFDMILASVQSEYPGEFVDVDCQDPEVTLPTPDEVAAVIVTGSPARVASRDPWILRVEGSLVAFANSGKPVFGICFGHQLLGSALGGVVLENPRGREIGTVELTRLGEDELFFPPGATGAVVMSHLDSVIELPKGAQSVASTLLEPHAAVRFGENVWGVQFHPEMDAEIIGDYLTDRRDDIEGEGQDVDTLMRGRVDSPYGAELLRRFVQLVTAGSHRG